MKFCCNEVSIFGLKVNILYSKVKFMVKKSKVSFPWECRSTLQGLLCFISCLMMLQMLTSQNCIEPVQHLNSFTSEPYCCQVWRMWVFFVLDEMLNLWSTCCSWTCLYCSAIMDPSQKMFREFFFCIFLTKMRHPTFRTKIQELKSKLLTWAEPENVC